ncbi:hypothetical protein [Cupriavidus necator]
MTLHGEWTSKKGPSRAENRDAGGLLQNNQMTLAVVVDASERGPHGAMFGRLWIKNLFIRATDFVEPNATALVQAMEHAHAMLRSAYPSEVAAYSALLLRHDLGTGWALGCGDCRVGKADSADSIDWLTPVHTVANMTGAPFTAEHAGMPERHTLTRSLKAKRFVSPDVTVVDLSSNQQWVLSTDGYWIEHLMTGTPRDELSDDASCLYLTATADHSCADTDCDNWQLISN